MELKISKPSWIQILVDDTKAFEGILQPGESHNWTGQRRVAVRAGNAGGVEVIVNGTSRGLMGAEGQVVDQIWEKVDDPALLTPQPGQDNTSNSLPPTETPAAPQVTEEAPLPLESAPAAEEPAPPAEPAPADETAPAAEEPAPPVEPAPAETPQP